MCLGCQKTSFLNIITVCGYQSSGSQEGISRSLAAHSEPLRHSTLTPGSTHIDWSSLRQLLCKVGVSSFKAHCSKAHHTKRPRGQPSVAPPLKALSHPSFAHNVSVMMPSRKWRYDNGWHWTVPCSWNLLHRAVEDRWLSWCDVWSVDIYVWWVRCEWTCQPQLCLPRRTVSVAWCWHVVCIHISLLC